MEEETEFVKNYCKRCMMETDHIKCKSSGRLLCNECKRFNVPNTDKKGGAK